MDARRPSETCVRCAQADRAVIQKLYVHLPSQAAAREPVGKPGPTSPSVILFSGSSTFRRTPKRCHQFARSVAASTRNSTAPPAATDDCGQELEGDSSGGTLSCERSPPFRTGELVTTRCIAPAAGGAVLCLACHGSIAILVTPANGTAANQTETPLLSFSMRSRATTSTRGTRMSTHATCTGKQVENRSSLKRSCSSWRGFPRSRQAGARALWGLGF